MELEGRGYIKSRCYFRSGVHFERRKVDNFECRTVTLTDTKEIHSATHPPPPPPTPPHSERWWKCSACVWATTGNMMRLLCAFCAQEHGRYYPTLPHPTSGAQSYPLFGAQSEPMVLKLVRCSKWSGAQIYPLSGAQSDPFTSADVHGPTHVPFLNIFDAAQ